MALFDESRTIVPARRPPVPRRRSIGLAAVAVALVVLFGLSLLPTSYVIEQPGPVYNTLGTAADADGTQVPLITIDGAPTYPTEGSLDLLTVQVVGSRAMTPSWLELASAWFDPSRAVVPIDAIFPNGQTDEQRNDENTAMMVDSQKEATAAALVELGYDVEPELSVYSVQDGSAAQGILQPGDVVVSADGQAATSASQLSDIVNAGDGAAVALDVTRDGQPLELDVTPKQVTEGDSTLWRMGVLLTADFSFPFDVTLQLDNVGGPSAGMMFALGIIDTLTPGDLNGGQQIAGTGTIAADGTVGPIGGIRQKLWGARGAGATVFLAPASNCDEVTGHVPPGIRVFSVATLEDSLTVLDTIREGGDLDALPTCDASTSAG